MRVDRLADGLWRWTAPHPHRSPERAAEDDLPAAAGSLYVEGDDAVVLVDPLAPADGTPAARRFWEALDADVARTGLPVHVVLTSGRHARSADRVAARYRGACIWAPADAVGPIEAAVDRRFGDGHALPAGLVAFSPGVEGVWESLLLLPRHGALVAGDVLVGTGDGGLRVLPASRIEVPEHERASRHAELVARLRQLLEHALEHVLVSHGEPVLGGARPALAAALAP